MSNGKKRNRNDPKQPEATPSKLVFYATLLLLFGLIAVASFLPGKRLWGINHLAFYPVPIRIAALFIMALSFIPLFARGLHDLLLRSVDQLKSRRRIIVWIILAASVLSVAILVRFQSSTLLLGDSRLIARVFELLPEREIGAAKPLSYMIALREPVAKGAMLLYYGASKISREILGATPIAGVKVTIFLLGGIFIFVLLHAVLRSSMDSRLGICLAWLVLSSAVMELFFGYIETYAPLTFFAALYLMTGMISIHRRHTSWILLTFLFLLVSVFVHIQGVLLVPSFLLLLGWFFVGETKATLLKWLTPSLAALTLIGFCIAWIFTKYKENFLPLRSGGGIYGILTPAHMLDVLNELLIMMPMILLFAVMGGAILWYERKSRLAGTIEATKKSRGHPSLKKAHGSEWFSLKVGWHFAFLILFPCLVFLILFRPELGMARDWDVFAIIVLGLVPAALLVLDRFLRLPGARSIVSAIMTPAMVLSVFLGIAWIGINASSARSEERFERVLEYDETHPSYVYETLAHHYYTEHRLGKAISAMERAVSFSRNPRQYTLLGTYYRTDGRLNDAIDLLREVLKSHPHYEKARHNLVIYLNLDNRYDELLEVAREGTQYHPEKSAYHFYFGMMLIRMDQIQEGVEELLKCTRLNPPPGALEQINDTLRRLKAEGKIELP